MTADERIDAFLKNDAQLKLALAHRTYLQTSRNDQDYLQASAEDRISLQSFFKAAGVEIDQDLAESADPVALLCDRRRRIANQISDRDIKEKKLHTFFASLIPTLRDERQVERQAAIEASRDDWERER